MHYCSHYKSFPFLDVKRTLKPVFGISALGLGCVKTLFKSKFAANLPDLRKLQFAKALISLKLRFWRLGFNHNLIRSLTFSHSLGHEKTCKQQTGLAKNPGVSAGVL
jgi:hypothetical protein